MNNSTIETLEEKLRQAMLHSDVSVLDELIADDLAFTGPTGEVVNKQADLDSHRAGSTETGFLNEKISLEPSSCARNPVSFRRA